MVMIPEKHFHLINPFPENLARDLTDKLQFKTKNFGHAYLTILNTNETLISDSPLGRAVHFRIM